MVKGFRDFVLRGNVLDLAIAVVVGAAFGGVVKAFADDFIGGIIGVVGGSPNFGNAGVTVNGSKIVYGSTITALINFVIIAATIYFVVIVPVQTVMARRAAADEEPQKLTDEAILLGEIRDLLKARN